MAPNRPLLVGITGGIGSGKTTICKIFSSLGIQVYNADNQARKLMSSDSDLIERIKSEFGASAYSEGGELNRDYLAQTVFSNPKKLDKLNALVHPAVAKDFEIWVNNSSSKYVIKEAALLIESGSYKHLDKLINVSASTELRIIRTKQRDTFRSEEEIRMIIDNQLSEKERNEKADYVIVNDETKLVINQVLELHQKFLSS